MANVTEISTHVREFLSGGMSLGELEDWAAEYSWNIHKRANQETQQLAYFVHDRVDDFAEGNIDETVFRQELAAAIRPFEQNFALFSYDKWSDLVMTFQAARANSEEVRIFGPALAFAYRPLLVNLFL